MKNPGLPRCCFFSDQGELGEAYRISDKMKRQAAVSALRNKVVEQLATEDSAFGADDVSIPLVALRKT